jgi:prolyl-tRNA synthetase
MSSLFLRTLREDPADAEVPSHRLMVRAGYIRRAAPGGFTWLPLGWLVYRNVESVIRAEMDAAGFQEVHFPALLPREPFEATGRWVEYGDTLFRLKDRRDNDYLLAPTHEEMFTLMVKDLYSSYRDLPVSLYQIQTKYRDEARPRAGLLRGREFVMKDSYSFDIDDEGLQKSYDRHREAYISAFTRLGLPFVIVSAMSGAMGGSASEEFLAPLEVGEDTFVRCRSCSYAANVEAVSTPAPAAIAINEATLAPMTIATPGANSITKLLADLNARTDLGAHAPAGGWLGSHTLKNLLLRLDHPDGHSELLAIGLPGDREVDMKRLEAQISPAVATPCGEDDFSRHPQLVKGYIGPSLLGSGSVTGIRYLVDPRVAAGSVWVSGADQAGHHQVGLIAGRDFHPDGVVEAAEIVDGDPCPHCGGELESARGIEIGHIFQLGRKYAEALDLSVAGPDGEQITVTMGSYGIGVSRAVAAIAEATADDLGLCWPREIAPADVHIVIAAKAGSEQFPVAEQLASDLEASGVRVLVDDRTEVSVGVKFKDAELIGIPTIVVVGRGATADPPTVELKDRATGERSDVALSEVVAHLGSVCGGT